MLLNADSPKGTELEDTNWFPEREDGTGITQEEAEAIARRAAWHVEQKLYNEVGRLAVRLALYTLGLGVLAVLAWLGLHKEIKP